MSVQFQAGKRTQITYQELSKHQGQHCFMEFESRGVGQIDGKVVMNDWKLTYSS